MLIPSIDLMGGRAVQLEGGRRLRITSDRDPVELAACLDRFGDVAVVDLDAAMGAGDNLDLVKRICRVARVRAGGGVRSEERARALLRAGAERVIIGTARDEPFVRRLPPELVQAAVDHRNGTVYDEGWRRDTGLDAVELACRLSERFGSFLVTDIEREGGMGGLDGTIPASIAELTGRPVTAAGGAASSREVAELSAAGIDVQAGMSIYSGAMDPARTFVDCVSFGGDGLAPTVVRDGSGTVLMLAWSSAESLSEALSSGRGVYHSRARGGIWIKGGTSGNTQALVRARLDCDSDAILFTVDQSGPACHRGSRSCFGDGCANISSVFDHVASRVASGGAGSYSARLASDEALLASKILEESAELSEAEGRDAAVWEAADLLYFTMVRLARDGIGLSDVFSELRGRMRSEDRHHQGR